MLSKIKTLPSAIKSHFSKVESKRYAAGKTSRSSGNWRPVDYGINELISQNGPEVRARVRQLIRDFPPFSRAKRTITDFVVGPGIELQSRPVDKQGNYLPKLAAEIEDGYKRFCDEADIAGQLHGKEMERLARDQETETGEYIIAQTNLKDAKRYIPMALQMFEADWLTSYGAKAVGSNKIEQGVEYDSQTGRRAAFHFTDPDGIGKPRRIEARHIIHGFETLRPGQFRGISPFTPGVLVTRDLQDAMEGEIDGFKYAAKWLAIVKSMDPMGRQAALNDPNAETRAPIEELENGIIEYLRPNEDVHLMSNPRGAGNFEPFVHVVLLMISVATGVPYELLSGDYRKLSWAVIRVVRSDFKQSLKPIATRHIRQNCDPIFREYLNQAVMSGRIHIPDYFSNPYQYNRAIWQPPVADPVDKLRDSKADIAEMESLLRSPQEIVAGRGRQLEDVMKELAAAKAMAEKYGLTMEEVSTALANNPAAVAKD